MTKVFVVKKHRLQVFSAIVACLFLVPSLGLMLWIRVSDCPHPLDGVSFSRVICDRNGKAMRIGLSSDQKYRIRTYIDDIPIDAINAVIRYEDKYFWNHCGVNFLSIGRAALKMIFGGRIMGGSTITMQVARLQLGLRTGSMMDKIRQIIWALKLECNFTKAEILESYFNLAPYGGNVEGLSAAAHIYFHKSPSQMTSSESIALMLVPQNPVVRRPYQGNKNLEQAVARLMKFWTGDEEYAPLRFFGLRDLPFECPHLCGELLLSMDSSDYQIDTTIDLRLQKLIERQISQFTARGRVMGVDNASAILVHWSTREVRALIGSSNFKNVSISGQIDGTLARRSPGSTLKPAIYAIALDQGLIHPKSLLSDLPKSFSGYDPENFDNTFKGPLHADEALRLSRNIPAITLATKLAPPGLYGFLKNAGFKFEKSEDHYGLSLVLGGAEVTMRELATLYCAFPNRGVWQPLAVTKRDMRGGLNQKQIFSPEAAFITLEMLKSNSSDLNVRSRGKTLPLRVKTGTSNGFRDAWCAGFIGQYVLVVWIGNFDNSPNSVFVGGRVALPLFCEIARSLVATETMNDIVSTPSRDINVEKIDVCEATGDIDTSLCIGKVTKSWFIPGVSPVKSTGILRKILIDKKSGLRACRKEDGISEEVPWEFWPSDMKKQFLRAGIRKPDPPDYLPQCKKENINANNFNTPPSIVLPKQGLVYHASLRKNESYAQVALMAHATSGVHKLYWFSNGNFIGESIPGEVLKWTFAHGDYLISVSDDAGNSSVRRLKVRVAK